MKLIVVGNAQQQEEISGKKTNPDVELVFATDISSFEPIEYDACFFLDENDDLIDPKNFGGKPVFINSVIQTLQQKKLHPNFSRINAWPGFLQMETWEVASNNKDIARAIFERLQWAIVFVNDDPGFVSGRVISMIINEAFFALEQEVSSMDEIDLAMKLGTGYPYGPFEWQNMIGLGNVYHLLKNLAVEDNRYSVSPLLEKKYLTPAST